MQDEQNLSRARAIRAEAAKIVGPPMVVDSVGFTRPVQGWISRVHMVAHYIVSGEVRWLLAAQDEILHRKEETMGLYKCDRSDCWYHDTTEINKRLPSGDE